MFSSINSKSDGRHLIRNEFDDDLVHTHKQYRPIDTFLKRF